MKNEEIAKNQVCQETVLVVGKGGREHAICYKLSQSKTPLRILAAPGNAGIAEIATCFDVALTDIEGMIALAKQECVDLVVVAPDDPLAAGMVDALQVARIRAYGPSRAAAQIEASKAFAKEIMVEAQIPTANFTVCHTLHQAQETIKNHAFPLVIKADGLALGKGVMICQNEIEAMHSLHEMMAGGKFGQAGKTVVVEEFLEGTELTVLCFCDGKTVVPMVPSRDHKRAFDGNVGPNTGGMGAVSPVPNWSKQLEQEIMDTILLPLVQCMERRGYPFVGVLYAGLMITADQVKVIEFNARFGDPEAQVVLLRLETDLYEIFCKTLEGKLDEIKFNWSDNAAATVVIASGGYPDKYAQGIRIEGLGHVNSSIVFHAGTAYDMQGNLVTAGGRVLAVTATAPTIEEALASVYKDVSKISFPGHFYRRDIGTAK